MINLKADTKEGQKEEQKEMKINIEIKKTKWLTYTPVDRENCHIAGGVMNTLSVREALWIQNHRQVECKSWDKVF